MKRVFMVTTLCLVLVGGMFLVNGSSVLADDGEITFMTVWGGQELEAMKKVAEPFEAATGIKVQFESTRDLPTLLTTRIEAGNPPDIVQLTGMGMMKYHAQEGNLVNLKDVFDMEKFNNEYDQKWIDLATLRDGMYGLYISADVKSLIWYNPEVFAEKGYEIPETWEELKTLSEQMLANNDTPWSIGLESGSASGWPGTDWIEDIMLRIAGPEVYDQWVNHEIPWTDEKVKEAFKVFGEIARDPQRVYGGPTTVLTMNFGDAADPLFTDPPRAMMHRQASFITSFIKENYPGVEAGKDFDFFAFPPINEEFGTPILGAADMISMMNNNSEARAFMKYLASAGAQTIWVGDLGKLGINKKINPNVYPDDITRKMAAVLKDAQSFRFDGSDSMPPAIGSGSFWTEIMNYVQGDDLDSVLERLEKSAQEVY